MVRAGKSTGEKMTYTCGHNPSESYKFNPFGENHVPSDVEINKERLWNCPHCKLWYSLLPKEVKK